MQWIDTGDSCHPKLAFRHFPLHQLLLIIISDNKTISAKKSRKEVNVLIIVAFFSQLNVKVHFFSELFIHIERKNRLDRIIHQ